MRYVKTAKMSKTKKAIIGGAVVGVVGTGTRLALGGKKEDEDKDGEKKAGVLTPASQAAGAALWDQLESEKTAAIVVETQPLTFGATPRPGLVYDYAGDKVASGLPMGEAFEKIAGFWSSARSAIGTVGESLQKALTAGRSHLVKNKEGIPHPTEALSALEKTQLAIGGAGVAGGIALAGSGISAANERRRFSQVEQALYADPWFENYTNKSDIGEAYGLMRRYSPSIAKDPIVARSFVRVMVESPEMKHTQTVQELLEAEKKFRESGAFTEDLFDLRRAMRGGARALGLSGTGGK